MIRCVAVALVVAGGSVGCGGEAHDRAVVHVGGSAITKQAVDHWMSVMAPEHVVPDPPSYTACVAHQAALAPQSIEVALREECAQEHQRCAGACSAF